MSYTRTRRSDRHTHQPMEAFKVDGRWRCSGCGRIDAWGPTWGYHGALACFKCRIEPAINWVACSDVCRDKYDPNHETFSREHARATKQKSAEQLNAEIEVLRKRMSRLADERDRLRTESGG